jgi:hypothetical protein
MWPLDLSWLCYTRLKYQCGEHCEQLFYIFCNDNFDDRHYFYFNNPSLTSRYSFLRNYKYSIDSIYYS